LDRPASLIAFGYKRTSLYLSPFLAGAVFFNEAAAFSIGVGDESATAMVTVKKPIDDHQNLFELGEHRLAHRTFHFSPPLSIEKSKELPEKAKPAIRSTPVCCLKFIHRAFVIGRNR
jgi:hypothetical protein